jgi:murein L,D-transpeptidase YcbB/YkuD
MNPRQYLLLVSALACALLQHPRPAAAQPAEPGAATIQALAAQPVLPAVAHPWNGSDWLERFYAPRAYAPAWPDAQVAAALAVLDAAPAEGLDPADYGAGDLRQAEHGRGGDPARFDVALTSAMLHYLADLRLGRVRPEYRSEEGQDRLRQFDPVELLRGALERNRLDEAVADAEPAIPLYARVKQLLAHYRELAEQPQPRLPLPDGKVDPGGRYPAAAGLHERLVQLGDMPPDAPAPVQGAYDATLAQGVKRLQSRYGLPETGALDAATVAALNVPLATRVRELELTLERLRWLPDLAGDSLVAVDLPAYRLWAFDRTRPAEPALEMRVIIGKAVKTPTPLFIGQMQYLEFNPYWNVPRSILRKEILPKLAGNHGYLAGSGMEVVGRGPPTSYVNGSTIALLEQGRLRVRQRPGPRNSLGAVKFAMPNPMDIYLHATPKRELFRRTRRDLSHGCIRVEKPVELAQFVLRDQPEWNVEQIRQAMEPGPTRRVGLSAPVPVVLFYATAMAQQDGSALFVPDVYRLDEKLEQALQEHSERARTAKVAAPPPPTG